MADRLHPGLYFQEVAGSAPIEGSSTATGAFVGIAPKGKIGEAVFVTNWNQFVKEFGSFNVNSYLAYAVRGFFENGGTRAYISRVVHYATGTKTSVVATKNIMDGAGTPAISLRADAKSDGVWGNAISVAVVAGTAPSTQFTLNVYESGTLVETFADMELSTVEALTLSSNYVKITVIGTVIPAVAGAVSLTGGIDGIASMADSDYLGDATAKTGLYAFDNVNVNLVAIPGVTTTAVLNGLDDYVTARGDCFAIKDVPFGNTPVQAQTFVKTTANLSSDHGAIYFPFIKVNDPIGVGSSPTKFVPPSGHVMGAYALTDNVSGVWKAPAGTDVKLKGVVGLAYGVSNAEQDILNPYGVNVIRAFDGEGICVWGTRTHDKGEYKYIPVRRTVTFIQQSLQDNMLWTAFQNNDETLWKSIKTSVDSFLGTIWSQGGLKGASAKDAFFVKCDGEINTQDVIDQGVAYVDIGLAVQKPAEFIVFRLSLKR